MRPIVTDVAWPVCRYIGLLSAREPCKTAEPIEIRDALWVVDSGESKEHRIRWGSRSSMRERTAHCKVYGIPSVCGDDAAFCQITLPTCCYTQSEVTSHICGRNAIAIL